LADTILVSRLLPGDFKVNASLSDADDLTPQSDTPDAEAVSPVS
jgi:hypothetical protein